MNFYGSNYSVHALVHYAMFAFRNIKRANVKRYNTWNPRPNDRTGRKSLSAPIVAYLTNAKVRHSASVNYFAFHCRVTNFHNQIDSGTFNVTINITCVQPYASVEHMWIGCLADLHQEINYTIVFDIGTMIVYTFTTKWISGFNTNKKHRDNIYIKGKYQSTR